uniref:Uncharacterized protein n=1 Tax=Rhodosorus marinus TaxID=101924 RepID=A0A7S0FZH4_9RHOD|mmetsp:Transcript_14025/g.20376  ORF Transcript_14025/g.20376 Transcript_14025/m.20376 type:complete len:692 (+) Transcript_14025:253-2328(+)|eukprot:CAMPEP_0184745624 /NCGR_PEP_ID=MMETSP0315-20130426/8294_1 /TAXON_ID=101924 /ORGANISM="Rhodosorus marinus, Strain UTEX LB 2760" /LENGTH=691 /DNA_ID=CAMNT_0027217873 /DNA_START=140 /DNA_END=2215 /DNA_ORIENTATION=+
MTDVTLNISPVIVNVVTDVLLIVLALIWIWLTRTLSALEVKRDLRLGRKVFSFERIGSYEYFEKGRSKLTYLQARDMLEKNDARRFQVHTAFSVVAFGFTLALVSLHALIDYGLDFGTKINLDGSVASYQMSRLAAKPEVNALLRDYSTMVRSDDFCYQDLTDHTSVTCRRLGISVDDVLRRNLRETMNLGHVIFQAATLTTFDAIDHMEFDYVPTYVGSDASKDSEVCKMKAQYSALDFDGTFEFENGEACEQQGTYLRSLTIDLRVRSIENALLGTQSLNLEKVLTQLGISGAILYRTFTDTKDEFQLRTLVDITPVSTPTGATPEGVKVAEVRVNSGIEYASGGQRLLRITDLGRRRGGVSADSEFSVSPKSFDRDGAVRQDNERFDMDVKLMFRGNECGEIITSAHMDRCDVVLGESFVDGSGWVKTEFGVHRGQMELLFSEGEGCGAIVREKYGDQLQPGSKGAFVMGLQFEVACSRSEEGSDRVDCVYGLDTATRHSGRWTSVSDDANSLSGLQMISLKSEISWVSIEASGSDPKIVEEAFSNMQEALALHYPDVYWYTDRVAMRGRVLGAFVHFPIMSVLGLVSTQLEHASRDLLLAKQDEVAIIHVEYIAGFFAVLSICALFALMVALRFLQETRIMRRAGYTMRVPTTTTEWINSALSPSAAEGKRDDEYFEWTKVNNEQLF